MATIGTPIDINASNDYIRTNHAIRARMKVWAVYEISTARRAQMNAPYPDIPADSDGYIKAENFHIDLSNAYVFSKEDFDRFFMGDPNDPTHKNLKFTHCMIIAGALKNPETNPDGSIKQMGEQTILIAGCTPLATDTKKYITTADGNPGGPRLKNIATEHPPKNYKTRVTDPALRIFNYDNKLTNKNSILADTKALEL